MDSSVGVSGAPGCKASKLEYCRRCVIDCALHAWITGCKIGNGRLEGLRLHSSTLDALERSADFSRLWDWSRGAKPTKI